MDAPRSGLGRADGLPHRCTLCGGTHPAIYCPTTRAKQQGKGRGGGKGGGKGRGRGKKGEGKNKPKKDPAGKAEAAS